MDGLVIEVLPEPDDALPAGAQSFDLAQVVAAVQKVVAVIDAAGCNAASSEHRRPGVCWR
jgi:3-deoxy-D-arabino-heptulosonate 7-phosphate (DAHP) synthase